MKSRPVATAIAIAVGLIILLGTFLQIPLLSAIRSQLLRWAMILLGVAGLVGIANLFAVHFNKIRRREQGSVYSLTLLVAMLATLLVGIVAGPDHAWMRGAVEAVIIPVEASLMALLAVTLLYASIRLLRRRTDMMSLVFLGTAAVMLLGSVYLPILGEIPILSDWVRPWLMYGPAAGGARGLIIGVALGALATGLRGLFAIDRPYGGK
jgi:hypothetical protein